MHLPFFDKKGISRLDGYTAKSLFIAVVKKQSRLKRA
jgi:hypothetical protein